MDMNITASADTFINVPAATVWKALTDAALVRQYFFNVDVETDWQVGSPITYRGEWEGKTFEEKGNVLKNVENEVLESNYWSPSFGEDEPENYVVVRYELAPDGDGTHLTITQTGAKDQDSADHSKANWQMVLDNMKKLLETPAPI
ncbi:hypothetical protein BH10PAT3_BH10PAT3_1840 [soil metagenome]